MSDYQYSIGIDLGTTNSVLSYTALDDEQPDTKLLSIPQLTAAGVSEAREQLPSFIYMAHDAEVTETDAQALPWETDISSPVGTLARALGSKTPDRLIASAKSWLCHSGIDRHSACLPLTTLDDVEKLSPIEATYRYLDHLKQAWNHEHPDAPLNEQAITLTIPASFDPIARELTAQAAQQAGFENLTLLEEPQAAVYNWLRYNEEGFRDQVSAGDTVLVVDIGGGTTDLSLVQVVENDGDLQLERIAVGEHILLGGDNMDLALAYRVKSKLQAEGKELKAWQIQAITTACSLAKETLLAEDPPESINISIPSRGSKLIGGTLSCELTHQEVLETLIDGFFPIVNIDDEPRSSRRSALSQQGLPYAQDPAITKHLAQFLCNNGTPSDDDPDPLAEATPSFIKPTAVLLNGGVLKSEQVQSRLMQVINHWLESEGAEQASLLDGNDLDKGVSLGASFSGFLKAHGQLRIRAGLSHSYYVGIESSMPAIPGMPAPLQALCIAPFGMEEGTETEPSDNSFHITVGEPVYFQFFSATTRQDDSFGALLADDVDELTELPDIQLVLESDKFNPGERVNVQLVAEVTEIGTLALHAIEVASENPETFQIELDIRQAS